MALVDLAELKGVLGIGNLYPDTQVQQVADAASNVVLEFLQRYDAEAVAVSAPTTGTLTLTTGKAHDFYVGQALTLVGMTPTAFNGAATVTVVTEKTLTVTRAHAQTAFDQPRSLIPPGAIYDTAQQARYNTVPEVREAALAIAVDIWQSRVAPGGQLEAVDFTPGPYRLGRSLLSRVTGLLSRWMDTGSMVG
jgi:hypothetical protein